MVQTAKQLAVGWVGLGWVGLGWVGLGWVGLGWVGLGWVGLGWDGVRWGGAGVEWGVGGGVGCGGWGGVLPKKKRHHSDEFGLRSAPSVRKKKKKKKIVPVPLLSLVARVTCRFLGRCI